MEVNVLGPFHCAAHAVKPMLAQGSGSIVNVTSGAHLGNPAMGVYGASKGAIASMTWWPPRPPISPSRQYRFAAP